MASRSSQSWLQLPSYVFKRFILYRKDCACNESIVLVIRECTSSIISLDVVNMVGGFRLRKSEVQLRQIGRVSLKRCAQYLWYLEVRGIEDGVIQWREVLKCNMGILTLRKTCYHSINDTDTIKSRSSS